MTGSTGWAFAPAWLCAWQIITEPPAPWQLGLTNPTENRMPGQVTSFAHNQGGRQAGVLLQGRAFIAVAGNGEQPGEILAIPMLPQSWYVIEPGCWHAVVQEANTNCAWAGFQD